MKKRKRLIRAAAVLLADGKALSDFSQMGPMNAHKICCAIMGFVYSTSVSGNLLYKIVKEQWMPLASCPQVRAVKAGVDGIHLKNCVKEVQRSPWRAHLVHAFTAPCQISQYTSAWKDQSLNSGIILVLAVGLLKKMHIQETCKKLILHGNSTASLMAWCLHYGRVGHMTIPAEKIPPKSPKSLSLSLISIFHIQLYSNIPVLCISSNKWQSCPLASRAPVLPQMGHPFWSRGSHRWAERLPEVWHRCCGERGQYQDTPQSQRDRGGWYWRVWKEKTRECKTSFYPKCFGLIKYLLVQPQAFKSISQPLTTISDLWHKSLSWLAAAQGLEALPELF